ncbi:MAG: diacylglycerol kinase family lipid kinase [Treponema sp.]|nr:diacylglycerol kinase family lipid kinase [Treponema sp.]
MATGKLWIVLNPTAGKGKAARKRGVIERILSESGRAFETLLTKGPGDAQHIARELPLGPDDVTVAAGGDGTCNEVVNGLLSRHSDAPPLFGILPIGRGNDFAFTPGIPCDAEGAARALVSGKTRPLDIGLVKGGDFPDGRYFANGVGIGFDTKVGLEAAKMKIKSGLSYALGALITLARYEPSPVVRVRYGETDLTMPAVLVSVVNGRRMGGVFYMGPNAVLDDGLLDFCAVRRHPSRLGIVKIILKYTKGTQAGCAGVHMGASGHFLIEALEGGLVAHCDGETLCLDGKSLEISCLPGALRLVGSAP